MAISWSKLWTALKLVLALVFLLQSFKIINIIPVESALSLFGQSNNVTGLFLSLFFLTFCFFVVSGIFGLLANRFGNAELGSNASKYSLSWLKVVLHTFFAIIAAFFFTAILSTIGVYSGENETTFMNLYLFWFLIISDSLFNGIKQRHKVSVKGLQQGKAYVDAMPEGFVKEYSSRMIDDAIKEVIRKRK